MKVFTDIFSKEELFTDCFEVEDYNDVLYKVKTERVTRSDDLDPSLFGANTADVGISGVKGDADDDGGAAVYGGNVASGYGLVLNHDLKEFGFNKGEFKTTLSEYLKRILAYLNEKNPSRVQSFKKGAMEFFTKELLPNFDKYSFYTNNEYDTACMVPFAIESDDGKTAEFFFWKDGVIGQKY